MNQSQPKFHLDVTLSEQDYLDFNYLTLFRSAYGKKQILLCRITFGVMYFIFGGFLLFRNGISSASVWSSILALAVWVVAEIFLRKWLWMFTKLHIKRLEKKKKNLYSAQASYEVYEQSFSETTPDAKTEVYYRVIDSISVVGGTVIYLHVNHVVSYILPVRCFVSQNQYEDFLDFMRSKCAKIEIY